MLSVSRFERNKWNVNNSCAQWQVPNNSEEETAELRRSILSIGAVTGIDPRFILAVVMQESTGCVRVITTVYSHPNPGLMQSFNGTGSCNWNGIVQTPCPASEIRQQILDGTNGTVWGPGLVQDIRQQGLSGAVGYYRTAKIYNGGSIPPSGNLEDGCCTSSYASDIANRLTGWVSAPRFFNSTS